MSHDEKVEWLRQKFFSLKNAIHRTHVFDNNGNRLRAHLALGYQSIQSAMLCLNGAVSFRCESGSAPLVRVTFPSRHDGFRFVLPGTAQIAASSILGFSVFCDAVDQREFGQWCRGSP
ncbi:MAG: hypothetical protein DMG58_19445 [Acidobacteria bacterium]|nr:MAG: hypothetical protein DMG58_19445 [Acidobacteriota bacterium]